MYRLRRMLPSHLCEQGRHAVRQFSGLNRPARRCPCLRFAVRLATHHARLEVRIESLLLFRRALASPTTCRFIPAHSHPCVALSSAAVSLTLQQRCNRTNHLLIKPDILTCYEQAARSRYALAVTSRNGNKRTPEKMQPGALPRRELSSLAVRSRKRRRKRSRGWIRSVDPLESRLPSGADQSLRIVFRDLFQGLLYRR